MVRGSISDGRDMSNKVVFDEKLYDQVSDELLGEGKVSIVRLDIVDILQGCLVGVKAFTKNEFGPSHVGQAQFLGTKFYCILDEGLKPEVPDELQVRL